MYEATFLKFSIALIKEKFVNEKEIAIANVA
jgi:hypothetical protein